MMSSVFKDDYIMPPSLMHLYEMRCTAPDIDADNVLNGVVHTSCLARLQNSISVYVCVCFCCCCCGFFFRGEGGGCSKYMCSTHENGAVVAYLAGSTVCHNMQKCDAITIFSSRPFGVNLCMGSSREM